MGLLKSPPNARLIAGAEAAAFVEIWIWCRESMLVMTVFGGITFGGAVRLGDPQETCRPAVEGMLLTMAVPAAASPWW